MSRVAQNINFDLLISTFTWRCPKMTEKKLIQFEIKLHAIDGMVLKSLKIAKNRQKQTRSTSQPLTSTTAGQERTSDTPLETSM